jgi:hypothetical protein
MRMAQGKMKRIRVVSSKGRGYPKRERWERPVTREDLARDSEMNGTLGHAHEPTSIGRVG